MSLSMFVHFNGNCRQAVEFYADAFAVERPKYVTYGEMPESAPSLPESAKDWVVFTQLNLGGSTVMFSDAHPGMSLTVGDNVTLFYATDSEDEIVTLFDRLKEGGTVGMDLQETSWCRRFGNLTDKFGVVWHLSLGSDAM